MLTRVEAGLTTLRGHAGPAAGRGAGRSVRAPSTQAAPPEGANHHGNGFWSRQTALPGVSFRAPSSTDRAVKLLSQRSSSACSPEITDTRVVVYRYA